jgi:hypothetical protein
MMRPPLRTAFSLVAIATVIGAFEVARATASAQPPPPCAACYWGSYLYSRGGQVCSENGTEFRCSGGIWVRDGYCS